MEIVRNILSQLLNWSPPEYTVREGNVYYLDSTPLKRPLTIPRAQWIIASIIVALAVIIGGIIINNLVMGPLQQAERSQQAVSENLKREPSLVTIPIIPNIVWLTDDDFRTTFSDEGYLYYDTTTPSDFGGVTLYKLPNDVSLEDAMVLYAQGISNLDAAKASYLLNGSWAFSVNRAEPLSISVRYADFQSHDINVALDAAIAKEGFDPASITESGIDKSGNTFRAGELEVDGYSFIWQVSALPLDDIYDVDGLPSDAIFVGIRLTQNY